MLHIFSILLGKMGPLYLTMGFGYLLGKLYHKTRQTLAFWTFYVLSPLIAFLAVQHVSIQVSYLSLPFITLCLSSLFALLFLKLGQRYWNDRSENILAFCAGTSNTGYFGIPVAMLLFDQATLGLYVFTMQGIVLFESSVGFYFAVAGQASLSSCLKRVAKVPTLWALCLGLLVKANGLALPQTFICWESSIQTLYTIFGMTILGSGVAHFHPKTMDWKFLGLALASCFLVWPLCVGGLLFIDSYFLHFYTRQIHQVFFLISILPLATNAVVVATVVEAQAEKTASVVILSTLLALIFVPLMISLFFLL